MQSVLNKTRSKTRTLATLNNSIKVLHVFTLATTAESFFDGQFAYLSEAGYNIHVVASTEPIKCFCEKNAVTFHKIDVARRVDLNTDLKTIRALCKLIKREKFDAVFGHTPKGALVAMCSSWLSRVKTRVYFRHGLIYTTATGIKRIIFKAVEQFTALLATNIINVSPSLNKLAVKDHLNGKRKQTVIGLGTCGGIDTVNIFNPNNISERKKSEQKNNLLGNCDFVVGFCGRLCRDKGITELVDGFNLFKRNHPEIKSKLLLVGPYDERDILNDNTKLEIENSTDIITTGRQDKSILPTLYSLMDVFVFPSYREGFGMCVIEASAMKVPILVSRSHGCIDSIKENITGQYIGISAEDIANGLDNMLDPNLRKHLGAGGRDFVENNFDRKKMWPLIKDFYDEVILYRK